MISNKDLRVEGSNLIINGEKHPLDPAVDALIKRANTVQGKLSALDAKLDAIEALEKTASGNPISLTGVAAAYAMSNIMTIEPIQDLHGYSKPWAGGAGKNLLPITLDGIMAVNTSGTWSGNDYTINDVTFTIQTAGDGNVTGIIADGTANENTYLQLINPITQSVEDLNLTIGSTYTLTGCPSGGGNSTYHLNFQSWGEGQDIADYGNGRTEILTGVNRRVYVSIAQAVTVSNLVFKPQLELGSVATSYEPYSNICPISGLTSGDVQTTNGTDTNTATITFGQTVYGGSVNFKTGEVTVTHANISSYNGESINEPWLSSIDKYVSGATPTTGAQVVYPLTTPTTLTLTPAELELLKGNNTVSGNGANINLSYIGR